MATLNKKKITELIDKKVLPVIAGPTASGKTAVSIELAKLMEIEVISADSRQIFKYLNIGTATPSRYELNAVKTNFINILKPDDYYSAGQFAKDAEKVINRIYKKNKLPVVVGGSGLYIKALCDGIFDEGNTDSIDSELLNESYKQLKNKDINDLYSQLLLVDEKSANLYSDKNPRRVIRALAYYEATGVPFSQAHELFEKKSIFNPLYFGIDYPREELYNRINKRTEIIWKNGLLRETKNVLSRGFSEDLNSLNTVGYKEAILFLKGELLEREAIEKMKQNTRRYAKRQMTWFRKVPNLLWLKGNETEIAIQIMKYLKNL